MTKNTQRILLALLAVLLTLSGFSIADEPTADVAAEVVEVDYAVIVQAETPEAETAPAEIVEAVPEALPSDDEEPVPEDFPADDEEPAPEDIPSGDEEPVPEDTPSGDAEPVPEELAAAEETPVVTEEVCVDAAEIVLGEVAPEGLALDRAAATICKGDTGIRLKLLDADGTAYDAVYASSNPAVVTVAEDGTLKGVKTGKATVTATYGGIEYSCAVTVARTPGSFTANPAKKTLLMAREETMTVAPKFSKGYGSSCRFASSDESVATVDEYGLVTAHGKGTATITITSWPGKKAKATVTVYGTASAVALDRAELNLGVGMARQLTASIVDAAHEKDEFVFSSSNEGAATVDANGVVTALCEGDATITATAVYGGASAVCEVHVGPAPEALSLNTAEITIGVGNVVDLETAGLVSCEPAGSVADWMLTTGNKKYVTVSGSTFKGKAKGRTTVTIASKNGMSAPVTLTVNVKSYPKTVKLSPASLTLGVSMEDVLKLSFNSGAWSEYRFVSSNPDVVRADAATGALVALSEGEATVTCVLSSGTKKAGCKIKVLPAPTGIGAKATALEGYVGKEGMAAEGLRPEGTMCGFRYGSDDPETVFVDAETGALTLLKEGSANITITATNAPATAVVHVDVAPAPEGFAQPEKTSFTMGVGNKLDLAAEGLLALTPAEARTDYSYKSSKSGIVSISASNVLTAKKKGTTTVTIKTQNGVTKQIAITVMAYPTKISLSPSKLECGVDCTRTLKPAFNSGATSFVCYRSDNEAVASVDENGVVTTHDVGTATITCETTGGKLRTASCAVTVYPAPESIEAAAPVVEGYVGKAGLMATGVCPAGTMADFIYTSSDPETVSVDKTTGALTLLKEGSAVVTITASNNAAAQAQTAVNVRPAPEAFAGEITAITLGVGNSFDLAAEGCLQLLPEQAQTSFSFSTSSRTYATVSAAGVVKGVKKGSATITIRTHNGVERKIKVSVLSYPTSLKLTLDKSGLCAGMSGTLSPVFNKNAYSRVTFTSADEEIATVDADGHVQALTPGTVTITCACTSGKLKADYVLEVKPKPAYMIVEPANIVLAAGDSFALTARAEGDLPADYHFESLDGGIATVDAATGVVTACTVGTAEIRAVAYNGAFGAATVEVVSEPERLALRGLTPGGDGTYSVTMARGDALRIEVDPAPCTALTIAGMTSSDESVATVAADGTVTPLRSGTTDITVTAYNGAKAVLHLKVTRWTDAIGNFMISHAMGGIGGYTYGNCREAFEENYKEGHRIFEVDMEYTSDGKIVLWHDWGRQMCRAHKAGYKPTEKEFMSHKVYDRYTPMNLEALLKLMHSYPDITVITDSKYSQTATVQKQFNTIVSTARQNGWGDVLDRFIIQVYTKDMFGVVDKIYPFKGYIFTLYNLFSSTPSKSQLTDIASFCRTKGIDMITMPMKWWDSAYKTYTGVLNSYNIDVALHTCNSTSARDRYLSQGVRAIYTDTLPPLK